MEWYGLIILAVLIGCSLWMRICRMRAGMKYAGVPLDTKSSPLSSAVQELVGMAGGMYLSLIMLISFLKIDIPDRISVAGVMVDPLALTALTLSLLQPVWGRIWHRNE